MKMKNIFKILIILVVGAVTFSACDKEPELPWGSFDDMEYASDFYIYNLSWTDDTINTVLPAGDPGAWNNTLRVNHVRGEAQNVDVYIYFNNGTSWAGPYDIATGISFPFSKTMTAADWISSIPAYTGMNSFSPGHVYQFGLRITTAEGLVFQTNELIGGVMRNKISTNIRSYPGANFNLLIRNVEVCAVDMNDFNGPWTLVEWSDRFSAEEVIDCTFELAADGETIQMWGPAYWLGITNPIKMRFNKSNPYAWVPYFVDEIWGRTGHPYDIKVAVNSDYEAMFSSCDMEITIGMDIEAYSVATGAFLGWFDYGKWEFSKPGKMNEDFVPPTGTRSVDITSKR
jgi:hypothetical protein